MQPALALSAAAEVCATSAHTPNGTLASVEDFMAMTKALFLVAYLEPGD